MGNRLADLVFVIQVDIVNGRQVAIQNRAEGPLATADELPSSDGRAV
jgi:hypothetical protein